uniref:C2H2-type domain-containing protein n=1 Tax=Hucho hucho TaxID=62062 RepID=A0A4W5JC68_9TELE
MLGSSEYTKHGGGAHRCELCGKGFKTPSQLKWHQASVHRGEKPFQCPTCGKCFTTKTNLKIHTSVHSGERAFQCPQLKAQPVPFILTMLCHSLSFWNCE